jgi:hypothetical protein
MLVHQLSFLDISTPSIPETAASSENGIYTPDFSICFGQIDYRAGDDIVNAYNFRIWSPVVQRDINRLYGPHATVTTRGERLFKTVDPVVASATLTLLANQIIGGRLLRFDANIGVYHCGERSYPAKGTLYLLEACGGNIGDRLQYRESVAELDAQNIQTYLRKSTSKSTW